MNNERILKILQKYLDGNASEEERKAVEAWYESVDENTAQLSIPEKARLEAMRNKAFQRFLAATEEPVITIPFYKKSSFRIAASLAIVLGIAVFFVFTNSTKDKTVPATAAAATTNDVAAPRHNRAVLQLADGSKLDLDSVNHGTLALQGAVIISKRKDGSIEYAGTDGETRFNTITVPRGSKPQQLMLSDGSKVWLNVASSITYPVAFPGEERKVEISGEAYFEVARNQSKPFLVKKQGSDVEIKVLGTQFNVNAYDDEEMLRITLLEGSVQVQEDKEKKMLKPGQQAQVHHNSINIAGNIDLDQVMAWKDGKFQFDGADIETIMRQVSKWYDVEVVFESKPKEKLVADISRDVNVSELLEILEKTDLMHFEVTGKKILVKK
ncbi:FecR domain-containing protein [Pollutibacter soli]|uniref:FecR domain-containing protein n=1 Tax=Pollutibacter soli TaxID=3034157 RepID=UPI003013571F